MGYTGHEHYQDFGIINMNGRIYDPAMGRFFSPDPFIQDPENLQSFNQYSYVYNNPLKYTDPSGYLSAAYENYEDFYSDDLKFINPYTGESAINNPSNSDMVYLAMMNYYEKNKYSIAYSISYTSNNIGHKITDNRVMGSVNLDWRYLAK